MNSSIIIIGAGGHGKVVHDAIVSQNVYTIAGFVDGNKPVGTKVVGNYEVICSQSDVENLRNKVDYFIVAIGNNNIRAAVYQQLWKGFKPATVIHPSCFVGSNVKIGEGTVVLANAVLNSGCSVGINSIVNTSVVVDHDSTVGNHVYLKLGTIITNNCVVEDYCTTELGQIVINTN